MAVACDAMIHVMLPEQYLQKAGARVVEPRKRLMLAVLMTAVDDCRGSAYRRAAELGPSPDRRAMREALAYVASTDRSWPFSFENLCDAVGLEPGRVRDGIQAPLDPGRRASKAVSRPRRAVG